MFCIKTKRKSKTIHRLVATAFIDNNNNYPQVDHVNQVKTDNRVDNLRWATQSHNSMNRKSIFKNNTSSHKGVSLNKGKWRVRITANNKTIFGGHYATFYFLDFLSLIPATSL